MSDESEWTLIGKKSPQLPQMFYPVDNTDMTIKTGDIVAARCTMVNIVFPAAALSDYYKSPFSDIVELHVMSMGVVVRNPRQAEALVLGDEFPPFLGLKKKSKRG